MLHTYLYFTYVDNNNSNNYYEALLFKGRRGRTTINGSRLLWKINKNKTVIICTTSV